MEDRLEGVSGVVIADARSGGYPITYVSPGFERLTGYGAGEVLGRNCKLLQGPDTDPGTVRLLSEAIAAGREAYVTLLNYRADGTPFWNELSLAPQRGRDGASCAASASSATSPSACTPTRGCTAGLLRRVTGLANRAALHDELRSAVTARRDRGARAGAAVHRPRRLQARQRRAWPSGR